MLLPRLQPPLRAALASIARSSPSGSSGACLNEAFAALAIKPLVFVRHASHAQQGAVNKAKDGPGKRLGAKKSGGPYSSPCLPSPLPSLQVLILDKTEQYVIPGNIIFRQRGTHWFPGENCAMGRDHTIYATESGYVKYYKDPERHPKRQYIGVVFERDQVLPLPRNAQRRRRLNMVAVKMEAAPPALPGAEGAEPVVSDLVLESGVVEGERKREVVKLLKKKKVTGGVKRAGICS